MSELMSSSFMPIIYTACTKSLSASPFVPINFLMSFAVISLLFILDKSNSYLVIIVPSADIKLDIKKLKQCCDFLKTTQFAIKTSSKNKYLNQVIPINDSRTELERAMDSKAYIMGLK